MKESEIYIRREGKKKKDGRKQRKGDRKEERMNQKWKEK